MSGLRADRASGLVPVRTPKAAELIAGQLRNRIIGGQLAADDMLPAEAELLATFRVSRPTLREALRILESEELIDVRRGSGGGARVRVPGGDSGGRHLALLLQTQNVTLLDVYEARRGLEMQAVDLLLQSDSPDLTTLEDLNARADTVRDRPVDFHHAQGAFHRALVGLGGNKTLVALEDMLYFLIDRHVDQNAAASQAEAAAHVAGSAHAHHELVRLLRRRAIRAARKLWDEHLCEASDYNRHADEPLTITDLMS